MEPSQGIMHRAAAGALLALVLLPADAQAQTFVQTVSYLITGETDSGAVAVVDQRNCVVKFTSTTIETTFFFNAVDLKSIRLVSSSLDLERTTKRPRMIQFNGKEPVCRNDKTGVTSKACRLTIHDNDERRMGAFTRLYQAFCKGEG
jgi:hypothetical protein